jgi:seryl-tRNA synthetase
MDELHKYGEGRFGFGPRLVELMSLFDRDVRALADKMHAAPYQFPTLIGADALDRCRYLRSFPSALTMVSHIREDFAAIQEFARVASWDVDRLVCDREGLSAIECLLAPSVCFHYYAWLKNRSIESACITALGKCFRFESKNMTGLERLWDFTMREVIFVGPAQYVLDQRRKAVDAAARLLDAWGFSYEIKSATDPFFIEDYAAMAAFQLAFDLKFEILAPLPYKQKDLAIGSFNYHQDFFGRSFGISGEDGEPIYTGCMGFGLERVVLAFLAQHGVDPKGWPVAVAKEVTRW